MSDRETHDCTLIEDSCPVGILCINCNAILSEHAIESHSAHCLSPVPSLHKHSETIKQLETLEAFLSEHLEEYPLEKAPVIARTITKCYELASMQDPQVNPKTHWILNSLRSLSVKESCLPDLDRAIRLAESLAGCEAPAPPGDKTTRDFTALCILLKLQRGPNSQIHSVKATDLLNRAAAMRIPQDHWRSFISSQLEIACTHNITKLSA